MPIQDHVHVRVFVDGEEATEYEDPDGVDEDNNCVRYIDKNSASMLNGFLALDYDGQMRYIVQFVKVHDHGTLTAPAVFDFTGTIFKDPETGICTVCGWAFEGVEMVNGHCELDLRKFARMNSIGSLSISVYRAKRFEREELSMSGKASRADGMIPSPITELPECMFKGKDVKQTIKYINQRPFLGPVNGTADKYKFVPMNGTAGEESHFIFKHRDRKALQKLGCIPRNPTPPPDPSLLLEQLQGTVELKKRKDREKDRKIAEFEAETDCMKAENRATKHEVTKLTSQMALLLSGHTTKAAGALDPPKDNAVLTPTTSASATNDTEAARDLQEITNPNPKPKPKDIIDLTGDSDSD